MQTTHILKIIFGLIILYITLFNSSVIHAKENTYIRDYTYEASEEDTKISSRIIAIQEVKRDLLNELGTFISSRIEVSRSIDGKILADNDMVSLYQ